MKQFVLFLTLFGSFIGAMAQGNSSHIHRCYTDEKVLEAKANDPGVDQRRAAIEADMEAWLDAHPSHAGEDIITIPVVVHVLYREQVGNISTQQITSQIDILNLDFRRNNSDKYDTPAAFTNVAVDTEIEFCLAKTDPDGNFTSGITRTSTTVENIGNTESYYDPNDGGVQNWDPDHYLNIWVCEIGDGILGFTFPPGVVNTNKDGVVLDYRYFGLGGTATAPYNQGRTTTHEVGHWLNLIHPWGDATCGTDFVSDTPIQESFNQGCPTFPTLSVACDNSPAGDMFVNYMDYTNDACMNMFSLGQKNRMLAALNTARSTIKSSNACMITSIAEGSLPEDALSLFPNPNDGTFSIAVTLPERSDVNLRIYNAMGAIVYQEQQSDLVSNTFQPDLSSEPSGLYFVELTTGSARALKKVQVLR